ncbi:phosphorylase [Cupriavidus sp. USMAA2-4]|uniref:phosphorylase n=1 Tax=Cupriavidus sp. USMAA2-4 TaxID=876364 RepID=UPI000A051A63|nr:phosphorylase [Cupriavidus sp. USMAA2-4]
MGHVSPGGRDASVLVVCGMDFEARLAAAPGVATLYGFRAGALQAALEQGDWPRCAGVISFGVAGGLEPGLAPGAVVLADGVYDGTSLHPADADWLGALRRALPQARVGSLAGADAAVTDLAGKRALHQRTGALGVDMESHLAARFAQARGLRFAACRVVIDPADRAVPPAALAGMAADGSTDVPAVLRSLLRAPGQIGGLLRLARDASAARATLKSVRGRVGAGFALPAG